MKRTATALLLLLAILTTLGCSHNYFNIPKETYTAKVKVLGVAPIFVDAASDIRHPGKDELVAMVREQSRKNESELVAMLRESGGYKTVVPLAGDDPEQLFAALFFRRELRDDAGIVYNKYFFKEAALRDVINRNQLDALLVVVISGLTKKETIYSSNFLSYLESDYNYLIATAQVLNADNQTLWEFPNFRQRFTSFPTFLNLQYPDFDEARANVTDSVEVKFKTIPGIGRAFAQGAPSTRRKGANLSNLFAGSFDEMVALLKNEPKTPQKPVTAPANAVPATLQQSTTAAPQAPAASAAAPPVAPAAAPLTVAPAAATQPAPAAPVEPQTAAPPLAKPQPAAPRKIPEMLPDESKIQSEPPPIILKNQPVKTE